MIGNDGGSEKSQNNSENGLTPEFPQNWDKTDLRSLLEEPERVREIRSDELKFLRELTVLKTMDVAIEKIQRICALAEGKGLSAEQMDEVSQHIQEMHQFLIEAAKNDVYEVIPLSEQDSGGEIGIYRVGGVSVPHGGERTIFSFQNDLETAIPIEDLDRFRANQTRTYLSRFTEMYRAHFEALQDDPHLDQLRTRYRQQMAALSSAVARLNNEQYFSSKR